MKKTFKIVTVVSLIALASCSKDEPAQTSPTIETLKNVVFPELQDVVVKKEFTSIAYPNPEKNGLAEQQIITTTQKSGVLSPLSPSFDTNTELIYPGSILRGSSFLNARYDPLVLSNAFEKVKLSTTLKGASNVVGDFYPTQSDIRTGINQLVALQANNINQQFIPAIFDYTSQDITTSESLVKSMNIHANINASFALSVSAKFGYEKKETNTVDKHSVLISFRQKLYSASIDPKYYKDWIKGGINVAECGEYEPLYISNVDYGRTAYVLFETNLSTQQLVSKVTASLSASYGVVSGSAETQFNSEATSTFSQNSFKAYIYGGPLNGGLITNLDGLRRFLTKPTPIELIGGSVPISYTVRRLRDNTEVDVRTVYKQETAAFPR
ncbi:Flavomodulin [Flavobacterium psychrophilum]|uniref:thiol-activated cytolysin family protein n=1 Tax=Flavobacterium psychrophilum TaxID=96345 RepID=UPI00073F1E79|nr:thiol-activated cytolysin family protein [Flavobacterium psychrophilum]EKT3956644.1 thiol-activated cytolysin family protein [Flavobacterium psychrophilum]EKT3967107.1 thiol-activated cytolysin family protein [Flavobacterium psychrophilum]EKT4510617.1 thiol-activated cytolysin family protein [Flavobacterium psychrophilum]SNB13377.1 Flavomodulin [Flavobacterium psychrophilum]SNB23263.1 Flavomodulin [Flavobacterium psychrophilum]